MRRDGKRKAPASSKNPPAPAPPLPRTHPAMLVAALACAVGIAITVTFEISDPDLWQHLIVGKALWSMHRLPTTQVWTWPTYGAPDVNGSWGFEGMAYPFHALAGVWGLQAWCWLTALVAFALAWLTAWRMGARGFTPFVVIAWCALIYGPRSAVRPESVSAILLMISLGVLETRRRGGRDLAWLLVPVAFVWINVHIAYWFGFALIAAYGADEWVRARRFPRTLMRVSVTALAASFVNPFGWRALWAPFDYALHLSHEPIFQDIGELHSIVWGANFANGLPLLMALWPLLMLWRMRHGPVDVAERILLVLFTGLALLHQRFLGAWALVAAVFISRGLDEWIRARRWPRWTAAPATRAALASLAGLLVTVPEHARTGWSIGVGLDTTRYSPAAACDFIGRHGLRGRFFNNFSIGGYMLWRFWPERERLPFMDTHVAGTPEIRKMYVDAIADPEAWRSLDQRWRFDAVLLEHPAEGRIDALDVVSRDSTFVPIFLDDSGGLLIRRDRFAALADSFGYRVVPPGREGLASLRRAASADPALRALAKPELIRMAAGSRRNEAANEMLGLFAAVEGRWEAAEPFFRQALVAEPSALGVHEKIGLVALITRRPELALREFVAERKLRLAPVGLDLRFGQAYQALGDAKRARASYEMEIRRGPYGAEAADSIRSLDRSPR